MSKRGGLSELDKLLAGAQKRQARIKAADEAIHGKGASTEPVGDAASSTAAASSVAFDDDRQPTPSAEPTKAALPQAPPATKASVAVAAPPAEVTHVVPIFSRPFEQVPITPLTAGTDSLVDMLASSDADEPNVRELLCGGWVQTHYARRPCPEPVLRWLFAVACHHPRAAAAVSAARTLGAILSTSNVPSAAARGPTSPPSEQSGQPRHQPGLVQPPTLAWVPGPADFLDALRRHGADLSELIGADDAALPPSTDNGSGGGGGHTSGGSASRAEDPRQNLVAMLGLLPACCRRWDGLGPAARVGAVRWMARLTLDPHAALAFVHLQDAIAALLDSARDEAAWVREWEPPLLGAVSGLVEALPHASVVRLLEFLPPTLRAVSLQRAGAVVAIRALVTQRRKQFKCDEAERRQRAKELRAAEKARRAECGEEEDDDEDDDDEDDEDEDEDEDSEAEEEGASAARSLCSALEKLDVAQWSGRMDGMHSILVLVDLALSSDPSLMRQDAASLGVLKRRLNAIKQRTQRYRGAVDYHGLECENFCSFIANKLDHLYLKSAEDDDDDDDDDDE